MNNEDLIRWLDERMKIYKPRAPHMDSGMYDAYDAVREHVLSVSVPVGRNIKYILPPDQEQLLTDYTKFLENHGYVDTDVWAESPTAIEGFKEELRAKQ